MVTQNHTRRLSFHFTAIVKPNTPTLQNVGSARSSFPKRANRNANEKQPKPAHNITQPGKRTLLAAFMSFLIS